MVRMDNSQVLWDDYYERHNSSLWFRSSTCQQWDCRIINQALSYVSNMFNIDLRGDGITVSKESQRRCSFLALSSTEMFFHTHTLTKFDKFTTQTDPLCNSLLILRHFLDPMIQSTYYECLLSSFEQYLKHADRYPHIFIRGYSFFTP